MIFVISLSRVTGSFCTYSTESYVSGLVSLSVDSFVEESEYAVDVNRLYHWKEDGHMTNEQKALIREYRTQNMGYRRISALMGMSENTVKSFYQREERKSSPSTCLQCGKVIVQTKGTKRKKFCNSKCRTTWWNAHPNLLHRKRFFEFICPGCGQQFKVYGNSERKYCSFDCYIKARYSRKQTGSEGREIICQG